jgi:hypothetical protein
MTVDVEIRLPKLPELLADLEEFRADQIPFALSGAMNLAARSAVRNVRDSLSSTFDLRSRSLRRTFGPSGRMGDVSRGWSSKRQWPRLAVTMHSLAPAMELQEEGGTKPNRASEVWIGTKHVPRSATTGKKPQRYQPSRLRKRLENKRQRGPNRIYQRGDLVLERIRSSGEVRPLYLRRPRATVQPALGFERIVESTFTEELGRHFERTMGRAMRSRRR